MTLKFATRFALGAIALLRIDCGYAGRTKVAVSNSYIGNEWRVQMIKFMEAYTAKNLQGKVELTVNNSGTDAQKQIAVLSDMISAGVSAIRSIRRPIRRSTLSSKRPASRTYLSSPSTSRSPRRVPMW